MREGGPHHCEGGGERRLEGGHLGERDDARVVADAEHDRAEVLVDAPEARLLVRHRAAAEDRLEVDPLALDRVELREGAWSGVGLGSAVG